jgi:hypothetical protein
VIFLCCALWKRNALVMQNARLVWLMQQNWYRATSASHVQPNI